MEKIKILIIEDSEDDCELLLRQLRKEPWELQYRRVDNKEAVEVALKESWDLILSDFSMPGFGGLAALQILNKTGLDIPFILVSGTVGEEAAVEVMKAGARDFILKSRLSRLGLAIRREVENAKRRQKNLEMEKALLETEDQLRHAQKMEAVGQLAGGVAHDFNNMLSVVQIYCRKIKEFQHADVNAYVDRILAVQAKSISLTKQLLIFSRRQPGSFEIMNFSETLKGMQDMLQRLLGESIELSVTVQNEDSLIKADQNQIEQVIMNLAVNARDAMPSGGRLAFTLGKIIFNESKMIGGELLKGPYILLRAEDTGSGMSKEVMQRIFEPFFTTKSKAHGTGLGLSIIYGIIRQILGEITVSSTLGKGTVFEVYIPEAIESPAAEVLQNPAHTNAAGGNETILLVEDNNELRGLFAEILFSQGYKVFEASDGQEALDLFEAHQNETIDLVITDLIMPKISGKVLQQKVTEKIQDIKFLFMSGYFEGAITSKNPGEKDFNFLQKPFSEQNLLDKVRNILDA